MKPNSLICAVIICGAVSVVPAVQRPAAAQITPPEFTIDGDGWIGGARNSVDSGQFNHCGISRDYGNGMTVSLLMSPRYELNIGLLNPAWTLITDAEAAAEALAAAEVLAPSGRDADDDEEDDVPMARIDIDGLIAGEYPVRPMDETVLMVNAGVDEQLVERLMTGNSLLVTSDHGSHRFALTGTQAGLTAVRQCIDAARDMVVEQALGNGERERAGDKAATASR